MDQRPDQLDEPGWIEDRRTSPPRAAEDEMEIEVAAVEFDDSDVDLETERIKADIEDSRAEIGQTINEIQERLSPEHLMDQVKETVREATIGKVERVMERVSDTISNVTEPAMDAMGRAGEKLKETGSSVTNIVQQNPIPCALIGLGLGMFIVNRIRNADSRTSRSRAYQPEFESGMAIPRHAAGAGRQYGGSYGEYAGGARQYGASTFRQVKDSANEFAHDAAERVSHLGHQAREGAMRAGRTFQEFAQQNPLAVGAAAVAVGAVVGLALPSTRLEHEYLGEASEKLVDKAQQVARDAMDKVKTATQGETGNAGNEGQQAQQGTQGQQGTQAQAGNQGQTGNQAQSGQAQSGQAQSGTTGQGKSRKQGQQPGLNG